MENNRYFVRSTRICQFYLRGNCSRANCRFSHSGRTLRDLGQSSSGVNRSRRDEDCRYFQRGFCFRGDKCLYRHEIDCTSSVVESAVSDPELQDKTCPICLEVIENKPDIDQKFGILSECIHSFCFSCIIKWRRTQDFEGRHTYSCPVCRVKSKFVYPSKTRVNTEAKDDFIRRFNESLATKDCKYFKKGRGWCEHGNECLYLHALPDGTVCDLGPSRDHIMQLIGEFEEALRLFESNLSVTLTTTADSEEEEESLDNLRAILGFVGDDSFDSI